jgi:hypothetical protein
MTTVLATTEYLGYRAANGDAVVRRIRRGRIIALPLRLDLDNHSPTGFEWGYGGSGPAQLALAILADALEDDGRAQKLHQQFKWTVIAGLAQDAPWRMSAEAVLASVQTIERLRNNPP